MSQTNSEQDDKQLARLVDFMQRMGYEYHPNQYYSCFTKDEGTCEITMSGAEDIMKYFTNAQLQLVTDKEEALKQGFYAGQAMAGVELDDCHNNWKKWNTQ